MMTESFELNNMPIECNIVVHQRDGNPAVEIRKILTEPELIKKLISAAVHSQPIIIQPKFNNNMIAISSLVQKGILYRENNQYYFTI